MADGPDTMEPDTQTRRQVLKRKQQKHRVTGYEAAVNAKLEEGFGDPDTARDWRQESEKQYNLAREIQTMIDELPDTDG